MYELHCKTKEHNYWDLMAAFENQKDAIEKIIELANDINNIELVIMNGETGEIGIAFENGKLTLVGKIDF